MKYKIVGYLELRDCHILQEESGKQVFVDLFTDSTFDMPPAIRAQYDTLMSIEELKRFNNSFIGKEVEVENITPYIPHYFGIGVKLLAEPIKQD